MLSVAEWYDTIARSYENLYGEEQRNKIYKLYEIYEKLFGEYIFDKGLDVGCGIGISTSFLLSICKSPFACDISKNMIRFARKNVDCDYIICDGENLPFKSETFDVVTCITVLQDTLNTNKMLSEIKRVLKNKGILFLTILKRNGTKWKPLVKKYFKILWFEEEEKDLIFILQKE